jgi:hypothetical protein
MTIVSHVLGNAESYRWLFDKLSRAFRRSFVELFLAMAVALARRLHNWLRIAEGLSFHENLIWNSRVGFY